MRSVLRLIIAALAASASTAAPMLAYAQAAPTHVPASVTYRPGGGTVTPGNIVGTPASRAFVANINGGAGGILIRDRVAVQVGAANADMFVQRTMTWGNLMRGGARALPYIAVGVTLYEIFNAVRCQYRTNGGTAPGIACDEGVAPVPGGTQYYWVNVNNGFIGTGPAVMDNALMELNQPGGETGCGFTSQPAFPTVNPPAYWDWSVRCFYWNGQLSDTYTIARAYLHSQGPALTCPNGGTIGRDGRCPTGNYVATDPDVAADRAALHATDAEKALAPEIAPAITPYVDLAPWAEPAAQPLTGPASVAESPTTTTTTNPQGQTSTTTTQVTNNITYQGDSYTYTTNNTQVNPDGSTSTTTGAPEIETCGLPGTPACRIDETGTPAAPPDTSAQDGDAIVRDTREAVTNPDTFFPQLPPINWTFALPSGCSVIPTPAFSPALDSVDICQFQPMFHDLMGVVWVLGGLFGAIRLFWRDQLDG